MIRQAYVGAAHRTVAALDGTAVDRWLSERRSPLGRHLWSLSTIYDVDRMARLDLPWWTYDASAEVDGFLREHGSARVFEYGSGASTLWLAARSAEVHSVEHDTGFAEVVAERLAGQDHVELHVVPPTPRTPASTAVSERAGHEADDFGSYVATIDEVGGRFDLVVVDGRARSACLEAAVGHLAEGGVIVFDNARRKRYRPAIDACGLEVTMHRGFAPSLPYREATALLRHPVAPS